MIAKDVSWMTLDINSTPSLVAEQLPFRHLQGTELDKHQLLIMIVSHRDYLTELQLIQIWQSCKKRIGHCICHKMKWKKEEIKQSVKLNWMKYTRRFRINSLLKLSKTIVSATKICFKTRIKKTLKIKLLKRMKKLVKAHNLLVIKSILIQQSPLKVNQ